MKKVVDEPLGVFIQGMEVLRKVSTLSLQGSEIDQKCNMRCNIGRKREHSTRGGGEDVVAHQKNPR